MSQGSGVRGQGSGITALPDAGALAVGDVRSLTARDSSDRRTPDAVTWRLLDTGARDGRTNMAIDEAILEAYRSGRVPPTLRFYRWSAPTVSLGHGQNWGQDDEARCRKLGVEVVRRPSGGWAVLHEGELTYSVVGSGRDGLGASIRETYGLLLNALQRGLRHLGVEAEIGPSGSRDRPGTACFQVGTNADLIWRGRKLAGSAQCRRGGTFLQHGSILIDQDLERLCAVLQAPPEVARNAVTLKDILGRPIPWEEVKQALCRGFGEFFGIDLLPGLLRAEEEGDHAIFDRTGYHVPG